MRIECGVECGAIKFADTLLVDDGHTFEGIDDHHHFYSLLLLLLLPYHSSFADFVTHSL